MKPGIVHFMAYPETIKGEGPILETLREIALDGYFDAVEVTWIKDPEVRIKVKALLETAHMSVYYGAQPRMLTTGMNINDSDPIKREEALYSLMAGIDEAYELGAKGYAFLSGRYDPGDMKTYYAALLDSTCRLCAYAAAKGDMPVLLEVFDYDLDKKSLIGPAPLAARFAADIEARGHTNFGLMVDLSHIPQLHETIAESVLPVYKYIRHIHIGNAVITPGMPAFGDQHPRFGFPGSENDVLEVTEFLRLLMELGILNEQNPPAVSFEVKPQPGEDPAVVIANAKRVLERAWARL